MNLKQFLDGAMSEEFEMDVEHASLVHLYDSIIWQLEEYDGDVNDAFVVLHDHTIIEILIVLKTIIEKQESTDKVFDDLMKLAKKM